ncbi:hypothetical protein OU995_13855 [Roseateles sp. SL47]|uniref:hypothetical protein n=1 Tax=Roseateles sp. SL47 TaxID=2995138 RepID=UPI00227096CF|nr:hypothetical protein [Roseateles sp. SL47]WAC75707.1 hypothetical protein OU995_13855 [Roseateles sp. SL47]
MQIQVDDRVTTAALLRAPAVAWRLLCMVAAVMALVANSINGICSALRLAWAALQQGQVPVGEHGHADSEALLHTPGLQQLTDFASHDAPVLPRKAQARDVVRVQGSFAEHQWLAVESLDLPREGRQSSNNADSEAVHPDERDARYAHELCRGAQCRNMCSHMHQCGAFSLGLIGFLSSNGSCGSSAHQCRSAGVSRRRRAWQVLRNWLHAISLRWRRSNMAAMSRAVMRTG